MLKKSPLFGQSSVQREFIQLLINLSLLNKSKNIFLLFCKREGIFVAEKENIIFAFQSLDKWAKYSDSFNHVGVIGTFVLPAWRKKGIGCQLTKYSFKFARKHKYEKLVIYVRASNVGAITFYRNLGFIQKGILTRQVKIDSQYDDEIFMEFFL